VKIGLARQFVERDPPKAEMLLAQLEGDTGDALENLRDLARGIYPPLLADRGLPAALTAQAENSPIPVVVEPDGIGRYPQDVEAAVYVSALEALQNVTKYAEASRAFVRLSQANGILSFSVEDDGRGFDPGATGYGTGLQGMADRVEALGGRLVVTSAAGRGTVVAGRVPAVLAVPAEGVP
jgi:signal transduction histidine kinase